MRKATGSWIKEAKDEFDSAIILYEHEKYRGACFHSQQAVEKGLKALILEKGKNLSGFTISLNCSMRLRCRVES